MKFMKPKFIGKKIGQFSVARAFLYYLIMRIQKSSVSHNRHYSSHIPLYDINKEKSFVELHLGRNHQHVLYKCKQHCCEEYAENVFSLLQSECLDCNDYVLVAAV